MSQPEAESHEPLRIGLTGGIASGKSTVADCFSAMGVAVIDADVVARELVRPGEPALAEIIAAFGAQILDVDGELDRRKLRSEVFNSVAKRDALERILHPKILAQLATDAGQADGHYVLLVIPLLAESGALKLLDRVLLVDCDETEQLARLQARDGIGEDLARQMLAAQASRAARRSLADDILLNEVPPEDVEGLVLKLHRFYQSLRNRDDARTRSGLRLP